MTTTVETALGPIPTAELGRTLRYFTAHGIDHVAELFVRDITQGMGESGVKAAIIKCATDTRASRP